MNSGTFSISANPRQAWVYECAPRDIVLDDEMSIELPAGRRIYGADINLLCIVANNGYELGEEIPLQTVWVNDATQDDGGPYYTIRFAPGQVRVKITARPMNFFNPTASIVIGNAVVIDFTQWQLKVYALF